MELISKKQSNWLTFKTFENEIFQMKNLKQIKHTSLFQSKKAKKRNI